MVEVILLFSVAWNVAFVPVANNLSMDRETYCREVLMKLPPHYRTNYIEICKEERK